MNTSFVGAFWPQVRGSLVFQALLVVAGSLLLAISAKVQVPFWPVPMTMQTFLVLMYGATMGARLAGATVLAYLVEGAIGLPFFAGGAGLAYLAGPTGGYLIGFLAGAVLVGWLADRGFGRTILTTLAAFLLGEAAIFVLGAGWLAHLIGPSNAVTAGVVPFLSAEALKVALACALLPAAWSTLK